MTNKRRRGIRSDWILSLKRSRITKRLRRELPNYDVGTTQEVATVSEALSSDSAGDRTGYNSVPSSENNRPNSCMDNEGRTINIPEPDCDYPTTVDENVHLSSDEMEPFEHFNEEYPEVIVTTTAEHSERWISPIQERNSEIPDIERLLVNRRKWENHRELSALIAIVGSVRYSVEQYEYTRNLLKEENPGAGDLWPSYYVVHKHFRDIIKSCLPHSELVELPKKPMNLQCRNSQGGQLLDSGLSETTETVRVFLPSAWAKLDIATSTTYELIHNSSDEGIGYGTGLEHSMTALERKSVINSFDHLMVPWRDETLPCGPGSLIKVWLKRRRYHFRVPFSFEVEGDSYVITAKTVATWCVGARSTPNRSYERATKLKHLTGKQRAIMRTLSTADCRSESREDIEYTILPGDVCTLLSAERRSQLSEFDALMINRFWKVEDGETSVIIIWIRANNSQTYYDTDGDVEVEVAGSDVVIHTLLSRQVEAPTSTQPRRKSDMRLPDGTLYTVYRMLLYCDDFRQSSSNYSKGSAGGCYFLPISLPPEARRSTSAVRIISLTPPGVSTNDVLRYIVKDLVHASVHGVNGTTPSGERIRIFVDVVGFVGDYPAAAATLDVSGHVSRAPCTLCTFRRLHASETDGARYGFTTKVHSGNTSFLRHAERHSSLRESGIPDGDANTLGMVTNERANQRTCPLMLFSNELYKERKFIPLNSSGLPVVSGLFDPYRCNFVAPDHLLTGISQDALNTVFKSLPSDNMRHRANSYICAALRENGLLSQSKVFNWDKKTIYTMSLSELYCVLVVAGPSFSILTSKCEPNSICRQAVFLLNSISKLIALTYWYPKLDIDGYEAVTFVHVERSKYISEQKRRSKAYVRRVDKFCRTFPENKEHLDKPNLHRLIELYEHSLPVFGHVREFMELVFEGAHQPLKRCIAKSNNHNAHIFATEHCVANDWQGRIASLSRILEDKDSPNNTHARRGLRRLLLGEKAQTLRESEDHGFITETDGIIQRLFTTAVHKRFQRDNRISNHATTKTSYWKERTRISASDLCSSIGLPLNVTREIIANAINWVDAVYPTLDTEEGMKKDLTSVYMSARRVKATSDGRKTGAPRGFDTITPNSVIQAFIGKRETKNKILKTTCDPAAVANFFVVAAILARVDDSAWVLCARCKLVSQRMIQLERAFNKDSFQLLFLSTDVRRVAVYHVCEDKDNPNMCTLDLEKNTVEHVNTPLNGALMCFQTREEGYPPRQA